MADQNNAQFGTTNNSQQNHPSSKYQSALMPIDDVAIGSNETTVMINTDDHELDTEPGMGSAVTSGSIQRQIAAAVQSAVEEPSFNLRLIEAVKQSRCLYDASDRLFHYLVRKQKGHFKNLYSINSAPTGS